MGRPGKIDSHYLFILAKAEQEDEWVSAGGHLREAFGGNDGCEGDHGVVAKMEKETGDDGAGAGARKRENDTDESEKRHEAPGPAELSTVHQAKEEPRDENSGKDTKGFGEKRIEVAAENGLFDERRDKYRHGHKQHGAGAAL